MAILPAQDLRSNLATWAVPGCRVPALAHLMPQVLPPEPFDPGFEGQRLCTTYFDTQRLALRKARTHGGQYLTLRVRCYQAPRMAMAYAVSAKTEAGKWRLALDSATAAALLDNPAVVLPGFLPAHLLARLQTLVGDESLVVAAEIHCTRYAVEDDTDRLTLDVEVRTDTDRFLPFAVLEYKSTQEGATVPAPLSSAGLRPLKLSKFLWATQV